MPKNAGKTRGRAAGSDPFRSNCFGHVKALRAEGKHRGASVLQIQFSAIDLPDIRERGGGVASVALDQGREVAEQVVLVEVA